MALVWLAIVPAMQAAEAQQQSASPPSDSLELPGVRVEGQAAPGLQVETEQLLRTPGSGNDPLRAIQSYAGVTFLSDLGGEPAVRGSSPRDNAYELDFLPVGYIFHFDGISIFNDSLLESFDLYSAAHSHRYTEATGAVIDARLRAPRNQAWQTTLDVSFLKGGFLVEGGLGARQSAYLAYRESLLFLFIEELVDEEELEFVSLPRYYDYQAKYDFAVSQRHTFRLQLTGARDKAELFIPEDSSIAEADPVLQGDIGSRGSFHSQGGVWDYLTPGGGELKTAISHLQSTLGGNFAEAGDVSAEQNDYLIKSQYDFAWGGYRWTWGGQYNYRVLDYQLAFLDPGCTELQVVDCRFSDGELREGEGDIEINALDSFLRHLWDFTQRWQLLSELHLAYDDYSGQTFTEPRFKLSYTTASANRSRTQRYYAATGRYHRFPSDDEVVQLIPEFGNPELNQPQASHYLLGFESESAKAWNYRLELYFKELSELVVGNEETRYSNDAEGIAYGLEFLLKRDIDAHWYGWASIGLSRTERTNLLTGEEFRYQYDQPLILNLVGGYRYDEDWSLGVRWRYQSGLLVTPIVGGIPDQNRPGTFRPLYAQINSERLPAYHRLDLRADRSFRSASHAGSFYVEINNLYNRRNAAGYDYNEDYSERELIYQLPLIIALGLKISLF